MKLKDIITEDNNWKVKDIIVMQKAHERVLKATASLQKAVNNLEKVSNKNANKPNGKMFAKDASNMLKSFNNAVMPGSKFWKGWEEYKKGGEAAFPNDWKTNRS
tara:strand:- start:1764 stop:2075 length:312 start_codon:yes stop_codon:yes gene_type:complete